MENQNKLKDLKPNIAVQPISNFKELKNFVNHALNDPRTTDESLIGISEDGDFCINFIPKPDEDNSKPNNKYNYDGLIQLETNPDFTCYGLSKNQNEYINETIYETRMFNESIGVAINNLLDQTKQAKASIINDAVDKITDINNKTIKIIADTILEAQVHNSALDKVDMITYIDSKKD